MILADWPKSRHWAISLTISALLLALALGLLIILILPAVRAKREEVFRE